MAKLWNLTTDKRVYTFTDENELNAFVAFWQCEMSSRELIAYISDAPQSVLKLARLTSIKEANLSASKAVQRSYEAMRACASDVIYT